MIDLLALRARTSNYILLLHNVAYGLETYLNEIDYYGTAFKIASALVQDTLDAMVHHTWDRYSLAVSRRAFCNAYCFWKFQYVAPKEVDRNPNNRHVKASFALSLLWTAKLYRSVSDSYTRITKQEKTAYTAYLKAHQGLVRTFGHNRLFLKSSMPCTYEYLTQY